MNFLIFRLFLLIGWLNTLACRLHLIDHYFLIEREPGNAKAPARPYVRMFLSCQRCGHRTSGWSLST